MSRRLGRGRLGYGFPKALNGGELLSSVADIETDTSSGTLAMLFEYVVPLCLSKLCEDHPARTSPLIMLHYVAHDHSRPC